jgi:hypothetical protein
MPSRVVGRDAVFWNIFQRFRPCQVHDLGDGAGMLVLSPMSPEKITDVRDILLAEYPVSEAVVTGDVSLTFVVMAWTPGETTDES